MKDLKQKNIDFAAGTVAEIIFYHNNDFSKKEKLKTALKIFANMILSHENTEQGGIIKEANTVPQQVREEDKLNYGAMVEEHKLYPVIYEILQNGNKVFKPKYTEGRDLTEKQIKYLYEIGYFNYDQSQVREEVSAEESIIKEITRLQEKYDENGYDFSPVIKLQRIEQHIDMVIENLRQSNPVNTGDGWVYVESLKNQIESLKEQLAIASEQIPKDAFNNFPPKPVQ